MHFLVRASCLWVLLGIGFPVLADELTNPANRFRLAKFQADLTCPIGHPLLGGRWPNAREISDPLYARGFVLLGPDQPIVLCAIDWCEIRNQSYDRWREGLAQAAGTQPERVVLSCLHQHDAPLTDLVAAELLAQAGLPGVLFDPRFEMDCIERTAKALRDSLDHAQAVTHLGLGKARVERIASSRRVIRPDGSVTYGRGSNSGGNRFYREAPEGLIDPWLRTLSFWNENQPLVAFHAYATHPMTYFGKGAVSADFVGLARDLMQREFPEIFQIYVSGCSGDVTAGKYNDGSPENRPRLARRLYQAMKQSWSSTVRQPLEQVEFRSTSLQLGYRSGPQHTSDALSSVIRDNRASQRDRVLAALGLASRRRVAAGRPIDFPCVDLGVAQLVLFPGETFVSYQLMAQRQRPESFVVAIGYGESWPGYIPSTQAFEDRFTNGWYWVATDSDRIIAAALHKVLPTSDPHAPLLRVVDLDVGEAETVILSDGSPVTVKLLALAEQRDDLRQAVRAGRVTVEINGEWVELVSATYNLPVTAGDVQIDCSITKGYNDNGRPESWGLDKDARLRLWPAGSPWVRPGTFGYPVKQHWFASDTQMANEPVHVDGVERPSHKQNIYYHNGLDIGGAEGMVDVVAATDGLVVSSGLNVLDSLADQDTPVRPRYDVVYMRDARGWYYRYSHLKQIAASVVPGRVIRLGDPIGTLGKEGGSGGWSHLHFGIKSRQPSGKWGTQEGYAFLWESYLRQYRPSAIAVARPHQLIWSGDTVTLDASKSWSESGKIVKYEWLFTDGTTASGERVARKYHRAGRYSEVLKITDAEGNTDYEFAVVQVIDQKHPELRPPGIHAAYAPTFGLRVGDEVTFKVRTFGTTDGEETWDFGDGSPNVTVRSDGNVTKLAADGYAVTKHRFERAGDFVVRVERTDRNGHPAIGHLHVHIGAP